MWGWGRFRGSRRGGNAGTPPRGLAVERGERKAPEVHGTEMGFSNRDRTCGKNPAEKGRVTPEQRGSSCRAEFPGKHVRTKLQGTGALALLKGAHSFSGAVRAGKKDVIRGQSRVHISQ